MLTFDKVGYSYQTSSIIEEVSFCLQESETLAVVGPEGSGKTTLALLIAGILAPTKGTIYKKNSLKIGLLFQNADHQIIGSTVEEDIAFGMENFHFPRELIKKRVAELGQNFALANIMNRPVHTLSGGEKKRLAIAATMAIEPDLLILDEPTVHLDPWAQKDFQNLLETLQSQHKVTTIYITHDVSEIPKHAKVLFLYKGFGQFFTELKDFAKSLNHSGLGEKIFGWPFRSII